MTATKTRTLTEQQMFMLARLEAKLTQTELALRVGIHQSRISRWEKGNHPLPDRHVRALWRALEDQPPVHTS